MDIDPITALIVGAAALLTALIGVVRLRRETPDLNEARLNRSIEQLEGMLEQYEKDRSRFLQELQRERGKVEALEQELADERERARTIIEAKQHQLDDSLRKIAILEHQKANCEEDIRTLRKALRKHLPPGGEEVA